jgi:hypothetical protein
MLEVPARLWDGPDPQSLDPTLETLQEWANGKALAAWSAISEELMDTISAALFAALLDDLHRMVQRVYNARRSHDASGDPRPFPVAILREPRDASRWPCPRDVIQELDEWAEQ